MSKIDEETGIATRSAIIQGLAEAEGLDVTVIELEIDQSGGDANFHIDSKLAEVVIAFVEVLYGCELPLPADLKRDQYATLEAIVNLVSPAIPLRLDV